MGCSTCGGGRKRVQQKRMQQQVTHNRIELPKVERESLLEQSKAALRRAIMKNGSQPKGN